MELAKQPLNVELNVWSGPMDLLLELVQEAKVNIYDIPINEITHKYLKTIELIKKIDMDVASEFLIMASRLIYIKSRMLLPVEYEEGVDEDNPLRIDPRKELINELLEYQKFKSVVDVFEDHQNHQQYIIERRDRQMTFTPYIKDENLWQEVKLLDLIKVFYDIVDDVERKRTGLDTVRNEVFSVDDKIIIIKEALESQESVNFYDLFLKKNMSKEEIIVTFWAILELYKQSYILIKQITLFSDIYIFKRPPNKNHE